MRDKVHVSFRREWLAPVVAVLTVCAFLPALRNGFAWDDEVNFIGNPYFRGLGWTQIRWMFTTAYLGPYQPLAWLSSGFDYALWGLNPLGYHLGNLLIHATNAALVYFLTLRLVGLAAPPDDARGELNVSLCAAAAALLFAVHPLRVEAVAWATERRGLLAGLFYFSTLLCRLQSGLVRRFAPLLFLISLLSKGSGIALPVTLLCLNVYPLRRLSADPRCWLAPNERAVLWEHAPFFLLAAAFGLVELAAYAHYPVAAAAAEPASRAARACFALVFYLVKTAVPLRLSPVYESTWPIALCGPALLAVTWLVWRMRERWPYGLPAWVHYVATLAPVLGLIKFSEHSVADRYSYLACAVWPALVAGGLWSLGRKGSSAGRFALIGAAVVVAGLAALSWKQTGVWRDSIHLWTYARGVEPDSTFARKSLGRSYYNAGNALLHQGHPREAWRFYLASLNADPANVLAYNNLGTAQLGAGRPDEAVASFCRALSLEPAMAGVGGNIRAVLARYPKLNRLLDDDCRKRLTKPG